MPNLLPHPITTHLSPHIPWSFTQRNGLKFEIRKFQYNIYGIPLSLYFSVSFWINLCSFFVEEYRQITAVARCYRTRSAVEFGNVTNLLTKPNSPLKARRGFFLILGVLILKPFKDGLLLSNSRLKTTTRPLHVLTLLHCRIDVKSYAKSYSNT